MFDQSRRVWEQPGFTVAEHTTSPPVAPAMIDSVVVHYVGAPVTSDPITWLRNNQRYYATNRGYSLGYNAVVDRDGIMWQVRGLEFRNAANKGANNTSVSVLQLVSDDEAANSAQVARTRRFVADMERWCGHPLTVLGHRDVGATACPGDAIYNQIRQGEFDPSADKDLTMKIVSPPQRVYDTRKQTGRFNDGETRKISVGQPNAKAVFVNVTAVNPNNTGFITMWGAGPQPDVSNVNYKLGDIVCNTSWVPVAGDGTIQLYSYSACDVLVDVQAVAS